MERLLITGASGFIGSHLVDEALKAGYDVWAAVRPDSAKEALLARGVKLVEVDYYDTQQMARALSSVPSRGEGEGLWSFVIHNAGITKAAQMEEFAEVNAEHTRRLLEALTSLPLPPKRFVLMSSLSSYGDVAPEGEPLQAHLPQHPHTHYGRSKCLAEHYVEQSGLPYTILLPTGVYGPGDKDYLIALESIAGGINAMTGLRPQQLTFVYGADVARAALFVLPLDEAQGQRYIVADGDTYTDKEFGRLVQHLLGRRHVLHLRIPLLLTKIVCWFGSLRTRLTGKTTPLNLDKYPIFAQRNWRCDPSPLFALGFRPTKTLEEGLRATLDAAHLLPKA